MVYHADDFQPCELLPVEAFRPDSETTTDRASMRAMYGVKDSETGPHSRTVSSRFFSCTAGWPNPPDSSDLFLALREKRCTQWQDCVIDAWLREATLSEILLAWIEEAYTWRLLVRAMHRLRHMDPRLNRFLNEYADPLRDLSRT